MAFYGGFIVKGRGLSFIRGGIGEKIERALPIGKPTAVVTRIHIPSINIYNAEIVIDVLIKNTKHVPIPLINIDYLIESYGRELVSGLIADAGTIPAYGEETIKIPITLNFDDIKNIFNDIKSTYYDIQSIKYKRDVMERFAVLHSLYWEKILYNDIQPGSIIPYLIKFDLIFDVPGFGRLTLPLQNKGEIPIPCEPDIDLEEIHFGRLSFEEEMVATLHLKLENKNDFDLELNDLNYEVWLVDVSIRGGAEMISKWSKSPRIKRHEITYLDLPITCRPKDFSFALWDMIRGRGIGYAMKGNIKANTPFGAMKLRISKEGGTVRLTKKNKEDGDEEDNGDKRIHQLEGLRRSASI